MARGIDPRKVTVIPNAVDVEKFTLGREPDEALRHAARPRRHDRARFHRLVLRLRRAGPAARSVAEDPRRRAAGARASGRRRPPGSNLKQIAASLSLNDKVVSPAAFRTSDVQRYYDLVDVLVYPRLPMRLTELVTPLKPLEAMAQGRLLVASDVGGHRELIRDQETGVLFRAGDVDALAAKVLDLLSNRQRWPQLRAAARRFVETERNWACQRRPLSPAVLSAHRRDECRLWPSLSLGSWF